MSDHVFRNPDKIQQLPQRDYIRRVMPNGKDGFVVEDLDLVLRWYGNKYKTDQTGKFALIELKHGGAPLGASKEKTFGLLDTLSKRADPLGLRYCGFYVINTDTPRWEACQKFIINGVALSQRDFTVWLSDVKIIKPYLF